MLCKALLMDELEVSSSSCEHDNLIDVVLHCPATPADSTQPHSKLERIYRHTASRLASRLSGGVSKLCSATGRLYVVLLAASLVAVVALVYVHRARERLAMADRAAVRLEQLGIQECRHLFPSIDNSSRPASSQSFSSSSSSQPATIHAAVRSIPGALSSYRLLTSDAVLPAELRVLVVNGHDGVANELEYILPRAGQLANSSVQLTHTAGIAHYRVDEDEAEAWYAAHRQHCDGRYDVIVAGDTIPLARPYLQGGCRAAIVLYVSNRYDYAMHGDESWQRLVAEAVTRPNVRVVPNNLGEQWYATRFRQLDLHGDAYIPASGGVSPLQCDVYVHSGIELPAANDSTVFVLNKEHAPRSLIDPLHELGIELPILPNKYGGQLALANRVIVHAPYQTNTMTLFEGLRVNVTFLLPALPLFRTWMQDGRAYAGAKTDRTYLDADDMSADDMLKVVDWYRPDLAHLFYYFDSLDELREGSAFRRRITQEAAQHRVHVHEFMQQHTHNVSVQWVELLAAALQGAK